MPSWWHCSFSISSLFIDDVGSLVAPKAIPTLQWMLSKPSFHDTKTYDVQSFLVNDVGSLVAPKTIPTLKWMLSKLSFHVTKAYNVRSFLDNVGCLVAPKAVPTLKRMSSRTSLDEQSDIQCSKRQTLCMDIVAEYRQWWWWYSVGTIPTNSLVFIHLATSLWAPQSVTPDLLWHRQWQSRILGIRIWTDIDGPPSGHSISTFCCAINPFEEYKEGNAQLGSPKWENLEGIFLSWEWTKSDGIHTDTNQPLKNLDYPQTRLMDLHNLETKNSLHTICFPGWFYDYFHPGQLMMTRVRVFEETVSVDIMKIPTARLKRSSFRFYYHSSSTGWRPLAQKTRFFQL